MNSSNVRNTRHQTNCLKICVKYPIVNCRVAMHMSTLLYCDSCPDNDFLDHFYFIIHHQTPWLIVVFTWSLYLQRVPSYRSALMDQPARQQLALMGQPGRAASSFDGPTGEAATSFAGPTSEAGTSFDGPTQQGSK